MNSQNQCSLKRTWQNSLFGCFGRRGNHKNIGQVKMTTTTGRKVFKYQPYYLGELLRCQIVRCSSFTVYVVLVELARNLEKNRIYLYLTPYGKIRSRWINHFCGKSKTTKFWRKTGVSEYSTLSNNF